MKKILYFFPINPLEKNEGNKMRALKLLEYFKDRNIQIDFVTQREYGSVWTQDDVEKFNKSQLASNLYILRRKPPKNNILRYLFSYKIPKLLLPPKVKVPKGSIPNHSTSFQVKQFNEILKKNSYDYIIISYAYWANMIFDNPFLKGAISIIDTHDFLSSQHQNDKHFKLGNAIDDEISRLRLFDQVWTISMDETYLFSQFLSSKVRFVPIMINSPQFSKANKKYDLIYVASQNQHNQMSAKWFFENVFPHFNGKITILVIGRITGYLKDYPGVTKIPFVNDLSDYYNQAKIAICPMLSGTGIKVKVVEALSYGLPVVCTSRGVDGLPSKMSNGCIVQNNPKKFAREIQQLLDDPDFYADQHQKGLELYNTYFSKEKVYSQLDDVFDLKL